MNFLKKNYVILLISLLIFNSCSNDDNIEENSTELKRPKKMTIVNNGGNPKIINFQYEGNNLKKFTVDNLSGLFEFYYQNGVLVEYKETTSSTKKYFYDGDGKLIQTLVIFPIKKLHISYFL
jgi:hypothetical protein